MVCGVSVSAAVTVIVNVCVGGGRAVKCCSPTQRSDDMRNGVCEHQSILGCDAMGYLLGLPI